MRRAALLLGVVLAGCVKPRPPPKNPGLKVDRVAAFVREDVADKRGWAVDVRDALRAAGRPVKPATVCQVLAIIEQESGYAADPAVPGLGKVVSGELDALFAKLGPVGAPVRRALLDHVAEGASATFEERLAGLRTEREADLLYREIVDFHRARHPRLAKAMDVLAPNLVERHNPITTAGSMQVKVDWALARPESEDLSAERLRDLLYTRRGGVLYGTIRLMDHRADYDSPRYRFADFNAGPYASRNAQLQAMVAELTGQELALDGDMLIYDKKGRPARQDSNSLQAVLAFAEGIPELSERQVRRDLQLEKEERFDETDTVRAIRRAWRESAGQRAPTARMPEVALDSPKMKSGRTTAWFADNVMRRYEACRARG